MGCTRQSALHQHPQPSAVFALAVLIVLLLLHSCCAIFITLLCTFPFRVLENNEAVPNFFAVWVLCLMMKLVHLNLNSKGAFLFNSFPRKTYMQSLLEAFTSFHCFMKNLLILWSMSKQCISNLWSFHHHFCRLRACGKYHLCHLNDAQKTKMNTSHRLLQLFPAVPFLAVLQIWKSSESYLCL